MHLNHIDGGSANRSVAVTNPNGNLLFAQNIETGASEVLIPTHNLSSGVYLFTLIDSGNVVETCKIIVR